MFGLEDKKRRDDKPTLFDLEIELKSPKKRKEVLAKIEERTTQIKTLLRSGQDKGEFDTIGVILQGYTALLKVIGRFGAKTV